MRHTAIQSIATLMIYLVLLLPLASSAVYADITSASVTGENGVVGYTKTHDFTFVSAQVSFDGESDPSRVKIGNVPFTSCAPSTEGAFFDCRFDPPEKSFLTAGPHSYFVRQLDAENVEIDSHTVQYVVDGYAPRIDSFIPSATSIGNEDFTLTLDITDPFDCVGLQNVNVFVRNGAVLVERSVDDNACQFSEPITLSATDITLSTGDVEVCATATDLLGQVAEEKCITMIVDISAPQVDSTSMEITGPGNVPLSHVGDTPSTARIEVIVSDTGSGIDTVHADLSTLNGQSAFANKLGTCNILEQFDDTTRYSCVWAAIPVSVEQDTNAILTFTAADNAGNTGTASVVHVLTHDVTGPRFDSIESPHSFEGDFYLGRKNNTIFATVTEDGIGFDESVMYLDLSEIIGQSNRAADDCLGNICMWEGIDITNPGKDGRTYEVEVGSRAEDFLGNSATGVTQEFKIDLQTPDVTAVSVVREAEPTDIFVSGDFIQVTIDLEEEQHVASAKADFSDLVSELSEEVEGECSREDEGSSTWQCVWAQGIGPLNTGKFTKKAHFTIVDAAGNTNRVSKSITVYRKQGESLVAEHFDTRVGDPSPFAVNRHLMEYINSLITFPITLDGSGTNAVPLTVELVECTGNGQEILNNAEPYGNQPRLLGTPEQEVVQDFFVEFSFDVQTFPFDKLEMSCNLQVVGLVDNTKVSNPEIETVNFTIEFFNQPSGELSTQIERKINETLDSVLVDSLSWVDKVEKIILFAEKFCGVYSIIENVMLIIAKITSIWGTCCGKEFYSSAVCCPNQKANAVQLEGTKEGLRGMYGTVKKWCSLIGCTAYSDQWSPGDKGIADDYFNWARKKGYPIADYRTNKGWLGNVEPKQSIILSAAFFCLPGVVHNIQKYRQVQCQYIECLENTANGLPVSICESQRDFMTCKYVVGEVFNLIPFAAAFSSILQNVDRALKNPLNTISTVGSAWCSLTCKSVATGTGCSVCSWFEFFGITKDVLCDLGIGGDQCNASVFSEDYWSLDTGVCDDVLERYNNEE